MQNVNIQYINTSSGVFRLQVQMYLRCHFFTSPSLYLKMDLITFSFITFPTKKKNILLFITQLFILVLLVLYESIQANLFGRQ